MQVLILHTCPWKNGA